MTAKIIVIGSLNMDLVVYTKRHPILGETIMGDQFATFTGGKGANQAIAAAKLGTDVQMVGKVGEDDFGKALIQNLIKNNVNCTYVGYEKTSTGTAFITVDHTGQNSIIVIPGANYLLTPTDIDLLMPTLSTAALIILQLEIPLETVIHCVDIADQLRIPVLLNPAPAQKLPHSTIQKISYLVPNEQELVQMSSNENQTIETIISDLLDQGCKSIILTRGKEGAYYYDRFQSLSFPSFPVDVVDTTAAGDAFIGGFTAAIVQGINLESALVRANAAGALAVTRAGAQSSLPTLLELENFLRSRNL